MLGTVAGLYRCPAVRFDTTIAYTNNPYSGSMRGYGNLESTFAVEAQMDDLADRLGLDPLTIRRRNATRPGDVNPQGFVITSCAMTECLDAVAAEIDRYIIWPGQATAYMLGMLEIRRLRMEAEQKLGPKFDIKAFHDRVLEDGGVPLGYLNQKIRSWIAASS